MLICAKAFNELNFDGLMEIYQEGNVENAEYFYPGKPVEERLALAIMGFREYLCEQFFKQENAQYWVLTENDKYISALRFEKHRDGLLLEALETHPDHRGQGYAKKLILDVLAKLPKETRIYSHVSKRNVASLATHMSCGFVKEQDYVLAGDGTVNNNTTTFTIIT